MARTSENGEGEDGSSSCVNRGNGDVTSIKQEILVDLDQSSNVSISLGEKDWPFVPVPAIGGDATSNELLQGTVIFGSNTSDPVSKEKIEKLLDNSTRLFLNTFYPLCFIFSLTAYYYYFLTAWLQKRLCLIFFLRLKSKYSFASFYFIFFFCLIMC